MAYPGYGFAGTLFAAAANTRPTAALTATPSSQPSSSSLGNPVSLTAVPGAAHSPAADCGFGRSGFRIQVNQDSLDDLGILDEVDDPRHPAASRAGVDVDVEYPIQAMNPGHRVGYPSVRYW